MLAIPGSSPCHVPVKSKQSKQFQPRELSFDINSVNGTHLLVNILRNGDVRTSMYIFSLCIWNHAVIIVPGDERAAAANINMENKEYMGGGRNIIGEREEGTSTLYPGLGSLGILLIVRI